MEKTKNILCEEELDISNAQELYQSLRDALALNQPILIDFSNTLRIDTSIAQIIYLCIREAESKAIDLKVRCSDQVSETMSLLGLDGFIAKFVSAQPEEHIDE